MKKICKKHTQNIDITLFSSINWYFYYWYPALIKQIASRIIQLQLHNMIGPITVNTPGQSCSEILQCREMNYNNTNVKCDETGMRKHIS